MDVSGGADQKEKAVISLVQGKSLSLYNDFCNFSEALKQSRENCLLLVNELDRIRSHWKEAETRCQTLELRCNLLEKSLKIEKMEKERLELQNERLVQELNGNSALKNVHDEEYQSRKRSIDFRTDDESDTSVIPPRKSRRSSSVPVQSIINSAPCRRDPIAIDINISIERPEKRKRHSLDHEDISDLIVSRQHVFTSKRNFLNGSVCDHCKEPIRYCVLFVKCNACKLSYHELCSRKLKMPCLPRLVTPKRNDQISTKALRLADYCPDSSPMIPHLIVHCVMHLEKTCYDSPLYTTLGNETKASKLLNDFKNQRNLPDLNDYDEQTIAGCVMMFLMQIRDPLILLSSHQEFLKAIDEAQLLESVNSLPTTHKDTLVYLINHWKNVAEVCRDENFTINTLCETLGPIVFGTSRQVENVEKNEKACASLLRILQLPFESLKKLIHHDTFLKVSRQDSDSKKNKPLITIKTNV